MIVLNVSATSQIISFIPRDGSYDTLELTDEQTNDTQVVNIIDSTVGEYYHTIEAIFDLVENHFYMLVLKDGTDVLFKDKVALKGKLIKKPPLNVLYQNLKFCQ